MFGMGTSVLFGYLSLPYPSQKGLGAVLVTLEESTPIPSLSTAMPKPHPKCFREESFSSVSAVKTKGKITEPRAEIQRPAPRSHLILSSMKSSCSSQDSTKMRAASLCGVREVPGYRNS